MLGSTTCYSPGMRKLTRRGTKQKTTAMANRTICPSHTRCRRGCRRIATAAKPGHLRWIKLRRNPSSDWVFSISLQPKVCAGVLWLTWVPLEIYPSVTSSSMPFCLSLQNSEDRKGRNAASWVNGEDDETKQKQTRNLHIVKCPKWKANSIDSLQAKHK